MHSIAKPTPTTPPTADRALAPSAQASPKSFEAASAWRTPPGQTAGEAAKGSAWSPSSSGSSSSSSSSTNFDGSGRAGPIVLASDSTSPVFHRWMNDQATRRLSSLTDSAVSPPKDDALHLAPSPPSPPYVPRRPAPARPFYLNSPPAGSARARMAALTAEPAASSLPAASGLDASALPPSVATQEHTARPFLLPQQAYDADASSIGSSGGAGRGEVSRWSKSSASSSAALGSNG